MLEASDTEGQNQLQGSKSAYKVDSDTEECNVSAARVRPFMRSTFRKRKLVQIANLHQVSKKAARPR